MSNLYEKVEKVINANTMDEAEELLYGRDGIQINSREYYERIIANFVKKKEQFLPKINDNIVFDLDENVKDIWDIIFISQYIQEQWIKQRKEIKKEIEKIKQNLKKETNQTKKIELINNRNKLLNSVNKINEYFQDLEKVKELNKINLETSKNINNVKYQKELYELKKAIRIIQKIRNSFEHRNERISIDKIIEIDNEKNRFKISIPSEYLDGFAKGRIIIKEEDKYIIKGVNDIVYPLLEELEFDPKKLESFFYNVEPYNLSMLLDYFNYDINKIYQLPRSAFSYPANVIKLHKKLSNNVDVTKLANSAFISPEKVIKIYNILKDVDITKLPDDAFRENPDDVISFCHWLVSMNYDITNLPSSVFLYQKNTKRLCSELSGKVDIFSLNRSAFEYSENTIKLFNELSSKVDITKLKDASFIFSGKTIKIYEELSDKIDITKLSPLAFKYPDNTIKLYNELSKSVDITKLPNSAFDCIPENVIRLDNELTPKGIDITRLGGWAFEYVDDTIELYKELLRDNIDITKLDGWALAYPESIRVLNKAFSGKGIDITKLPTWAFLNPEKTIKLQEKLSKVGIDITQMHFKYDFEYPDDVIKLQNDLSKVGLNVMKLPNKIINLLSDIGDKDEIKYDNIIYLLKRVNNNYERLDEFPIEFYTCDYELLDKMCKRYDSNLCKSIFGINNPKIIGLLIYANSVLAEYSEKNSINVNMNIEDVMKSAAKDTIKYKDNITAIQMDSNKYVSQFLVEDKNVRTNEDIKKYILDKFRNATAHFRFKLVKDNEGNIIEDKIYLYDQDNMGNNNFNIIIGIKDLLNIVRDIELEMNKIEIAKRNYSNSGYHKNNKGEYYNPYIDDYDSQYNPIHDKLFNEGRGRNRK